MSALYIILNTDLTPTDFLLYFLHVVKTLTNLEVIMATKCRGKKRGTNNTCSGWVYKCTKCGNTGCNDKDCQHAGFTPWCSMCGNAGKKDV